VESDEDKAKWAWMGVEWGRKAVGNRAPQTRRPSTGPRPGLGQYASYTGYVAKARYAYEMATRLAVVGEET